MNLSQKIDVFISYNMWIYIKNMIEKFGLEEFVEKETKEATQLKEMIENPNEEKLWI